MSSATAPPPVDSHTHAVTGPQYCRRWSISRWTLVRLIAKGLPAVALGEGNGNRYRIEVRKADEWMRRQGK